MSTETKKINQVIEKSIIDGGTGELISQETNATYTLPKEPDYIKLYIRDILYLQDMPENLTPFLMSLVKRMTYASSDWGNCVVLNAAIRKVIQEECGYKARQTVYNNTRKLIQGGILKEIVKDVYQLNPYIFGRGEWKDIEKIRAEVSYSKIEGRTFKANFEYEEAKKLKLAEELKSKTQEQTQKDIQPELKNQQSMFKAVGE